MRAIIFRTLLIAFQKHFALYLPSAFHLRKINFWNFFIYYFFKESRPTCIIHNTMCFFFNCIKVSKKASQLYLNSWSNITYKKSFRKVIDDFHTKSIKTIYPEFSRKKQYLQYLKIKGMSWRFPLQKCILQYLPLAKELFISENIPFDGITCAKHQHTFL